MNSSNPPDYYESLLSIYGNDKRFVAQELHGGILSQTDLILYTFSKPLHVIPHAVAMELFKRVDRKHGAVDWGDRTAAMTWGGTRGGADEGTTVIVGECYGSEMPAERLGYEADKLNREVGPFAWYPDPAEPGEIRKWKIGPFMWDGQLIRRVEGTIVPRDIPGKKWNQWKAGIDLLRVMMAYVPRIPHPAYKPLRNNYGGARIYISDACKNLIEEIKGYRRPPIIVGDKDTAQNTLGPHHAIDTLRYQLLGEAMQSHAHGHLVPGI
jgi:hypothetical protein